MLDNLLSSYDYDLPEELIAKYPANPADSAKLLVYEKNSGKITHSVFYELANFLPECALIFNDTKVFKARFYGNKISGAKCELFINKILANDEFLVQIRGKVKEDDILIFQDNLNAKILKLNTDGTRIVKFCKNNEVLKTDEVLTISEKIGHIPLPPYLKRMDNLDDEINYQSVFAKNIGAVAAPTASLHFTNRVLDSLKDKKSAYITLHVGAGTFASVECENIQEHKMHSEYFNLSDEAIKLINSDIPILGVGTTATRTIEYYARTKKSSGECDLFLNPSNRPIRQNYLLTNFHLPKSTLIMLVASFIGRQNTLKLYEEAIKNKYKFYSYGDAMLII
ncbi:MULTISPECIES: tRNA preQ1(34) S-adenosylmethionine ribosyltransferase-isomerase QueA [unclassified Campylobacter]|uniref:tRNA preQ1(34) S-adenosylmethionine ribosyltransferase-isomerase QueA n=1 Tax=unclassified Campylobacter TaxID=2593542 RepID=UPI001DB08BC8|nr:tRNA preQ1(34) S-adenosylmethionine ribosyltransferase-isomerase QueA [Campylobacter sp. RM12651]MBZ7983654.1 tRNA preQ1(34) S-adenosylmethionine ribosyltransferase-isomerase QueA [Campylobacter sp. RM12647]ULO03477.1 S-adenosylmethionine:tRNA ribosyltransferase-isomerase [Campylobacter sp. RM12651]